MSVQVDIVPLSNTLDMYGEADPSSAYSLCGHIRISLKSSFSLLGSSKTPRLLLKSLELTFEGKSEILTPDTGYSGLRLCSVSRELVPPEGVELSNEDQDPREPCRWNILFNLPIPGWLPESSRFGLDTGTYYALYATARIVDLENNNPSWLSVICSPFHSSQWSIETSETISIKRYREAPSTEPPDVGSTSYSVICKVLTQKSNSSLCFPPQVIDKLQIIASVPSYINIEDRDFPVTLRLRTIDLPLNDRKRLHLSGFSIDILQTETFSSRPSPQQASRFPFPSETSQPPLLPLREPNYACFMADISPFPADHDAHTEREFSLLPRSEPGVFKLDGEKDFAPEDDNSEIPTWYTLDIVLPFAHHGRESGGGLGTQKLRHTAPGPQCSVQHSLKISLQFTYDLDGGQKATENLSFSIPLCFARCATRLPVRNSSPISDLSLDVQSLPVYSQLFYSNGDRKPDPTPPPLYAPTDPSLPNFPVISCNKDYQPSVFEYSEISGLLSSIS